MTEPTSRDSDGELRAGVKSSVYWSGCLLFQAQNSIPDVIIWMLCGDKRIASYRCPAHQLLWSPHPDYRGKYCGTLQSYLLVVRIYHAFLPSSSSHGRAMA